MKSFFRIIRLVTMFGQLGFTLITPPVLMALLGWWLQRRFELGTWIMLVCILIGLVTSGVSAYKFYLRVMGSEINRTTNQDTAKKTVVFYTHE